MTCVDILAHSTQEPPPGSIDVADKSGQNDPAAKKDSLVKDPALGSLLVGKLANISLPEKPDAELKFYFDTNALSDLWIAVTWSG